MATIAAYIRVSTKQQDGKMQDTAIRQWADAKGADVTLYRDTFTGKTMNRPGWNRLERDIRKGKVNQLVVWKLDRLGRTVSGLSNRGSRRRLDSDHSDYPLAVTMRQGLARGSKSANWLGTILRGRGPEVDAGGLLPLLTSRSSTRRVSWPRVSPLRSEPAIATIRFSLR